VNAASDRPHARLKQTWLRILKAGAGSLVVAAAVVSAPPAQAAKSALQPSVVARVQAAREALKPGLPALDPGTDALDELAWWGNRWGNGGFGWHPWWHNWPNWHNWHNWGNW
jgi:hypothetical protein